MRIGYGQRKIDDATHGSARHRKLVERKKAPALAVFRRNGLVADARRIVEVVAFAEHVDAQVSAPLAHRVLRKGGRHDGHDALVARIRQKAETAEVDAEDRHARRSDQAGGT